MVLVVTKFMTTLTTIMSAYNAEKYLDAALTSILQQTCPSTQVIVIDDGSSDNTLEILQARPGITIVSREHKGIAYSLNEAISLATGEYLTFLDADDLWDLRKNALQLKHLQQNSHCDFSLCHLQQFDDTTQQKQPPQIGYMKQCLLIKTKVFMQVGTFNENSTGDFIDWFQRAQLLKLHCAILDLPLVFRRMHADNFTKTAAYTKSLTQLAKGLIARQRQHAPSL